MVDMGEDTEGSEEQAGRVILGRATGRSFMGAGQQTAGNKSVSGGWISGIL